jgi:autotransporter-associated beta strand protein
VDANLSIPIEGAGGELNFNILSEAFSSPAITNVSKVNLTFGVAGRLKSADWATQWTGVFPENTEVNVINGVEGSLLNGFGVNNTSVEKATVNLGDSIRLLRYYNENAQGTDTLRIGALNGTATSIIEGGFIDGRKSTYMFGGLNTDAEFAGTLRSFLKNDTAVVTSRYSTSRTFLYKVGTGTWTLSGNSPEHSGNIVVREGTLAISGSLVAAVDTVTVESGATLDVSGTFGIKDVTVYGTVNNTGSMIIIGDVTKPESNKDITVYGTFENSGSISGAKNMYVKTDGVFEGSIALSNNLDLIGATIKLNVADTHTAGAYDVITIAGDLVMYEGNTLDIKVDKATKGDKIKLIDCANIGGEFETILVNGKNISEQPFVWYGETGELEVTEDFTGIATVGTAKIVQAIQYYNLTGMQVTKNTTGFVIKKITYTDGSVETVKTFVKEK